MVAVLDRIEDDGVDHDGDDEAADDGVERGALRDRARDRDEQGDAGRQVSDRQVDERDAGDQAEEEPIGLARNSGETVDHLAAEKRRGTGFGHRRRQRQRGADAVPRRPRRPGVRAGALKGRRKLTLADLRRCTLLSADTRPDAWADWAQSRRIDLDRRKARPFEHTYFMLEAAASGLGMGIASHPLVEEDLRSGRLVAPFDSRRAAGPIACCTPRR